MELVRPLLCVYRPAGSQAVRQADRQTGRADFSCVVLSLLIAICLPQGERAWLLQGTVIVAMIDYGA